jgi:exodeoxyribonuclease VII small subunit
MEEPLNYEKALSELQTLVEEMEVEEIAIDRLEEKVKRALFLVNYCKDKLRSTEAAIKKALNEEE